jgi:uncharacterized protein with von Willebrand factor type A (vWA) domain
MEWLRELLAQAIRRQLVERRQDLDAMQGDFLGVSPTELRRMREAIRPLAQKLAARIARRRRHRCRGGWTSTDAFRMITERARKVYWLNPEPRQDWNAADSIMVAYADRCQAVFETRNLGQLAEFVGRSSDTAPSEAPGSVTAVGRATRS